MHRTGSSPLKAFWAAALAVVWVSAVVARSALEAPAPPEGREAVATLPPATPPPQTAAKKSPASKRVKKPVEWVALNPQFAGATFVNDRAACLECHEDTMRTYEHTLHAAALDFASGISGGDCESCHGPRSKAPGGPHRRARLPEARARRSRVSVSSVTKEALGSVSRRDRIILRK